MRQGLEYAPTTALDCQLASIHRVLYTPSVMRRGVSRSTPPHSMKLPTAESNRQIGAVRWYPLEAEASSQATERPAGTKACGQCTRCVVHGIVASISGKSVK